MLENIALLNTAKVLHIVAVISWMAGLLYLPRIFVYHCGVSPNSEASEIFKIMERKLFYFIMNPAMMLSWICGLYLAIAFNYFKQGWFHGKLLCVILMTIFHFFLRSHINRFKNDTNTHTHKYFRWLNEAPTLLMVVIVILVITKPF